MGKKDKRRDKAQEGVERVSVFPGGWEDRGIIFLLVVAHFVCPLLFFTDLTRNPYFTQITLLNLVSLGALALWALEGFRAGRWTLNRTPLDFPWALVAAVAGISWTLSFVRHDPFFRPSMQAEGARNFIFLIANVIVPFYLAARIARRDPEGEPRLLGWVVFWIAWGLLWCGYHQAMTKVHTDGILNRIFDPYGTMLWTAGLGITLWLTRRGSLRDFWHLIFAAGFFAAAYGLMQYFNIEVIWPQALNPYGGRAVSTFGNPNFLSSYTVVLMPLALAFFLRARRPGARLYYGILFFLFEASVVASMTRSSWLGGLAGVLALGLVPEIRARIKENLPWAAAIALGALLLVALWPESGNKLYSPSVVGRLAEIKEQMSNEATGGVYKSVHQRLLIWTASWQMAAQSPVFGNGYGVMELFYPFFQGPLLAGVRVFLPFRTHANNSHNEFLETFSQMGLAGLGAQLFFWLVFLLMLRRYFRSPGGREIHRFAVAGCAAGMFGMFVDNMLNVSLHFAVPAYLFWWQAGAAVALMQAGGQGWIRVPKPERSKAPWAAAAAAVILVAAAGSHYWYRQWKREIHYFRGFKLMRRGDFPGAVRELERMHAYHSREVNGNYELANAYAKSGNRDKAIWAYDEALKANAGYDEIYFNLATVLAQGNREERLRALHNYRMSLSINPLSDAGYMGISQLLQSLGGEAMNAGRHDEARAYFEEGRGLLELGVRMVPRNALLYNNLGFFRSSLGDVKGGMEAYAQALRWNPENPNALANIRVGMNAAQLPPPAEYTAAFELQDMLRRINEKDYTAAQLERARRLDGVFPENPKILYVLANLQVQHGLRDEAKATFRRLLRVSPGYSDAEKRLAALGG